MASLPAKTNVGFASGSLVVALTYIIVLAVLGWMSPRVAARLRDFDALASRQWQSIFLAAINLAWMLPLALAVGFFILWKEGRVSPALARQINVTCLTLLIGFFVVWLYAVFTGILFVAFPLVKWKHH